MTAPAPNYVYRASLVKVIDGDTIRALVDCGFFVFKQCDIRLLGINCPEINTPEGKRAKEFTIHFMAGGHVAMLDEWTDFTIESVKVDKYGNRWDARVWVGDQCLNDALFDAGLAVKVNWMPAPNVLGSSVSPLTPMTMNEGE